MLLPSGDYGPRMLAWKLAAAMRHRDVQGYLNGGPQWPGITGMPGTRPWVGECGAHWLPLLILGAPRWL